LKKRELKIAEIKKHNPTLYSKVKSGDLSVQEAHNIVQSEIMNVSEMKGQGTKSNKITLEQEFEIINKLLNQVSQISNLSDDITVK